ncbi:hypothetical protein [Coralloluteibacterium stylophorae]|uniref:Uncharacterized protein n=1 Tax=Coralloluteibacterium stylophorae TaxID=1776034 RepID=A0A8J7VW16_9GAMM|nr:hypothetical protein [Coralloluteibacterium stylophorae]MBS7455953.1 hypothetical protein [Coralloluteibacterium stylophorae]
MGIAILELAILGAIGLAIGGIACFGLFWLLSALHLRDHDPRTRARLGADPLAWAGWFLRGQFRKAPDDGLRGLAVPAQVGLWVGAGAAVVALVLVGIRALVQPS